MCGIMIDSKTGESEANCKSKKNNQIMEITMPNSLIKPSTNNNERKQMRLPKSLRWKWNDSILI